MEGRTENAFESLLNMGAAIKQELKFGRTLHHKCKNWTKHTNNDTRNCKSENQHLCQLCHHQQRQTSPTTPSPKRKGTRNKMSNDSENERDDEEDSDDDEELIRRGREAKKKMREAERESSEKSKRKKIKGAGKETSQTSRREGERKTQNKNLEDDDDEGNEAANSGDCDGETGNASFYEDPIMMIAEAHNIRKIVKEKVYKKVKFVQTKEKKLAAARKVAKELYKIKSGATMTNKQTRLVDLFVDRQYNAVAKIINSLRNEATTNLKREIMGTSSYWCGDC